MCNMEKFNLYRMFNIKHVAILYGGKVSRENETLIGIYFCTVHKLHNKCMVVINDKKMYTVCIYLD